MDFLFNFLAELCLLLVLTQSWNLLYGYTNMLHIGHRAFLAIGAYASTLLMFHLKIGFWEAAAISIVICAILGLLVGLPTVRFKADFLGVATLGFSTIVASVLTNWTSLTRGALGIPGIKRPVVFGIALETEFQFFLLAFFFMIVIQLLLYRIVKSPYGRVLETIREDDMAARAIGKNINRYRLQVLVLAAVCAGFMGVLDASRLRFVDPSVVNLDIMAFYMMATFAGGPGNFWGNILSSTILLILFVGLKFVPLPSAVVGTLRWVIFTAIFLVILMFKPEGIFSKKILKKKY